MLVKTGLGNAITVAFAIENKLTPDPYSYDGKLEKLERKLQLQSEMIASLIEALTRTVLGEKDIESLLGYECEVTK